VIAPFLLSLIPISERHNSLLAEADLSSSSLGGDGMLAFDQRKKHLRCWFS